MNDWIEVIKFAVFVVPLMYGTYKGWLAWLENDRKKAADRARETSVGEEAINKLKKNLQEANDECTEVKNRMKEMREEWSGFRHEMKELFDLLGRSIEREMEFLRRNQR